MNQEIVLYGKNNPEIVPEIEVWGLPISIYLFLGGFAAGVLFFTATLYVFKRDEKLLSSYQRVMMMSTVGLVVGVVALLFDLHKIFNAWRLYTHFDIGAPMSWGAWTLLIILPFALIWSLPYHSRRLMQYGVMRKIEGIVKRYRMALAFLIALLAITLGVYTGMLLSAFVARPLWNSEVLPLLFLFSGLSAGIATLIWLGRDHLTRSTFRKVDITLIGIEFTLFAIYIIDLYTGSSSQILAANELLLGDYAFVFWFFIVLIGLVVPFVIEIKETRGAKIPKFLAPALILIGSLFFRILIVEAGQILSI